MANRIQYRRDTAANWTAANPVLAAGEPGHETDTGKRKTGDGITAWTSLGYQAAPPATKRSTLVLGSDLNGTLTNQTDILQRPAILLPVNTTRWRLKIRNAVKVSGGITGAITLTDIYKGTPKFDNDGAWRGALTAAPTSVLTGLAMPSDGSDYTTAWVTDPTKQFAANTMSCLSMGITLANGQSIAYNGLSCNCWYGAGSSAQLTTTTNPTGTYTTAAVFLDIRLEYEFSGRNRVVLFIGDSTCAGLTDDSSKQAIVPGPLNSWAVMAAARNNQVGINAAQTGSQYSTFSTPTSIEWTRFDLATTPPDDAVLGCGINEANNNKALGTFQTDMKTVIANVRSLGVKRVYATTVMIQPQFKPGAISAAAASGVTSLSTSIAYANGDVVDIDYGTANYEQRTVTGASTGTGPYTTTCTAATGFAHAANARISLVGESRRTDYNKWLQQVPAGLDGVFDFSKVLTDPATPYAASAEYFGTANVHPGKAAYSKLAAQVEIRGTSPDA